MKKLSNIENAQNIGKRELKIKNIDLSRYQTDMEMPQDLIS